MTSAEKLLTVEGLDVDFPTEDGVVHAVRDVSLSLDCGEVLGIVGESGSGKSVSSSAIMGLLPKTAKISGSILFKGTEIVGLKGRSLEKIRSNDIAMIFQDPMTSLNPVYTVGWQLAEAYRAHHAVPKKAAWQKAIDSLEQVGIPQPDRRAKQYPHEFSGGMRQRVMIAMAIINDPELIIADEPTTALDVTVQAQVLKLLGELVRETGIGLMMISHDLSVLASTCERLAVMYAGRMVELGPSAEVMHNSAHPYSKALSAAFPTVGDPASRMAPQGLPGDPPDPTDLPTGCPFHPRCPVSTVECSSTDVLLRRHSPVHQAACVRVAESVGDPR